MSKFSPDTSKSALRPLRLATSLLAFLLALTLFTPTTGYAFLFAHEYQISINGKLALVMGRQVSDGKLMITIQAATPNAADIIDPDNPPPESSLTGYLWLYYFMTQYPGLILNMESVTPLSWDYYFSGPEVTKCLSCPTHETSQNSHLPNREKRNMEISKLRLHRQSDDDDRSAGENKPPGFFMFDHNLENWFHETFSSGHSSNSATLKLSNFLDSDAFGREMFHIGAVGCDSGDAYIAFYNAGDQMITLQNACESEAYYYHHNDLGVIDIITVQSAGINITYTAAGLADASEDPSGSAVKLCVEVESASVFQLQSGAL